MRALAQSNAMPARRAQQPARRAHRDQRARACGMAGNPGAVAVGAFPCRRLSANAPGRARVALHGHAGRIESVGRTLMCRSRSCCSVTALGASTSRSCPRCVFGNAITSRIWSTPAIIATMPVEAERDAAVRRRAVGQRVEQEAELLALVLGTDPERREHLRLHVGLVDAHRAAADLPAVQHDVVGLGDRAARDRSRTASSWPSFGAVNGWCRGAPGLLARRRIRTSGNRRPTAASTRFRRSRARCPTFARNAPSASLTTFSRSAAKKMRSPVCAPVRSMIVAQHRGRQELDDRRLQAFLVRLRRRR